MESHRKKKSDLKKTQKGIENLTTGMSLKLSFSKITLKKAPICWGKKKSLLVTNNNSVDPSQ